MTEPPPHYTREVNHVFPGRWIGRGGPIRWPARSPGLNPLDFYVWGWLKCEVYKVKVDTRDALIARIFDICTRIREHEYDLRRINANLQKRIDKCIEVNGGIFENFL